MECIGEASGVRMSRTISRRITLWTLCVVLVMSCNAPCQSSRGKDSFGTLPAGKRTSMFSRLQEFVRLQSTGQWGKLYDFSIEPIQKKQTREEFVRSYQEVAVDPHISTVLTFQPLAATLINEYDDTKEWLIEGCARYRRRGRIVYLKAGLGAALNKGEWYFSFLTTTTAGVGGAEQRCRPTLRGKRTKRPQN